jgi:hypothetical protein
VEARERRAADARVEKRMVLDLFGEIGLWLECRLTFSSGILECLVPVGWILESKFDAR